MIQLNHLFAAAPGMLLSWRYPLLISFFLLTVFFLFGMLTRFEMDMALESWFPEDDPAKLSLDRFRAQFGSDDGVYMVYRPRDGDIFSEKSLQTLRNLHQELERARFLKVDSEEINILSRISDINSLFDARYQQASGEDLISLRLLEDQFPESKQAREAIRWVANAQERFQLLYFSNDFSHGGIYLKTDFGTVPVMDRESEQSDDATVDLLGTDSLDMEFSNFNLQVDSKATVTEVNFADMQMDEYLDFMEQLKGITESPAYGHFEFFYTGNAPMMAFAMDSTKQAAYLILLMIAIVIGLLWFLFSSISAVIWPIVVIAASGIWTIGAASWLGITLSSMVSLTFMLVLAVGIADCVHVLSSYNLFREQGEGHRSAMEMAYRKTGLPILLTSVTTMLGMLALIISDIPQIGVFGITSAVAVMVAFVMTIVVLPVLLDIWHPYRRQPAQKTVKSEHWLQPHLNRIPALVSKAPRSTIFAYFLLFSLLLYGATRVVVDSNFAELTREGSVIRTTYAIVDQQMMGGQNMEIMIDMGSVDSLKQPLVLKTLDELQNYIEEYYNDYVIRTYSLADMVKDTHKVMQNGNPEYQIIPDDPLLTAQLLYLFDNANPEDRRQLVSDDYSRTHISIQLRNAGSYEYSEIFSGMESDILSFFASLKESYPEMIVQPTGSLALMMDLIDHISWTQIKSFSFALIIISIVLMITLGTIQGGAIAMLPNMLPAFFSFGMMGLLGVPLDTDTLIIAPLIIGIAVDDTIHFIAHYRDAWFKSGCVDQALNSTIREVGQAVTFTTLILGVGFSVLAFSDYLGLAKTGIFGSLAIFVALSSDLFLLPALIKVFKPDLGRRRYLQQLSKMEREK